LRRLRFERFFCLRDFLRRPPAAGAGAAGAGAGAAFAVGAGLLFPLLPALLFAGAVALLLPALLFAGGVAFLLPALLPAFFLAFLGVFNPLNGSTGLPAGNDNDPPILF
jgi:hypothetical protein